MKKTSINRATRVAVALSIAAFISSTAQAQTYSYSETGVANASTGVNYYSVTSGTNAGGDPFSQSSAQFGVDTGGSFIMNSGTLTQTNTQYAFQVGQRSAGSMDIQGGTLTDITTGTSDTGRGAVFGNATTGSATLTQEGGTWTVNTAAGAPALIFGRDGATASFTMTGGTFITDSTAVYFGAPIGATGSTNLGVGTLTLGLGSEVFELNASGTLTFGSGASYINYLTGTSAKLELFDNGTAGSTLTAFDSYVNNGNIVIDGVDALTSNFTETTIGSEDIYSLAVVATPEPSSYALMLLGLGSLVYLQRLQRRRLS